ncbi:MAG: caspase family protein [Bacteroidales bacterium]|nr:caspase family protein [Bacteroidales bacterium]
MSPPLQIDLGNGNTEHTKPDVAQAIDRSIDQNIPVVTNNNDRTFAVIIGNENYKEVAKVPHALNDAKVFAAYCEKTLGLPRKNIKQYADATFGTLLSAMENIQSIAKAYNGDINVIFYYAGHGIPNEGSNEAYLLPVDANGRNTAACYPIDKLYGELKALGANQVTVFLDACFSGAQRGNGMLASARGVAIKAKQAAPQGNMVVFSAASADETAYPYNEKGHGLFTYYLLKKLNETKGDVTLGELGSYICEKVAQESVVSNGKSQTPTVVPSVSIVDNWKNLKLTK